MFSFLNRLPQLVLLLTLLPHIGQSNSGDQTEGPSGLGQTLPAYVDGRMVDSISVDNRNIFDTDSPGLDNFVFRLANRMHIKTRARVVQRELLFAVGEPFSIVLAEETARNLRSRLQLYDAWIETDTLVNGHLRVEVVTIDEWTLSAGPSFSRDGNENRIGLSISDRNLMGRNKLLSVGYLIQDSEDNYFSGRFLDQRFWRGRVSLDARYSDNPANRLRLLTVSRLYYDLDQKVAWGIIWKTTRERFDIHSDNVLIGRSRSESDYLALRVGHRSGSYFDQLMFDVRYAYLFEKVVGADTLSDDGADARLVAEALPSDSILHILGGTVTAVHLDFVKLRQIDAIRSTEDFNLGQMVSFTISRAFRPKFRHYLWDQVGGRLTLGYRIARNLAYLSYSRQMWFQGGGDIRRLTNLSVYGFSYPVRLVTFAFRGQYVSDWRNENAEPLTLGGVNGIRGYDKYFRTGNRKAIMNAEIRLFPNFDILSVVFSPALFLDAGRTWKAGESTEMKDFYFGGGVGLRLAIGHSGRDQVIRLDLAHSKHLGWQISAGTEHYFKANDVSSLLTTR